MNNHPTPTQRAHELYDQAAAVARDDLTTAIGLLEEAVDLGDLDAAEGYLDKAEALARQLDAATERTDWQDDVARVRKRLDAARRAEDST